MRKALRHCLVLGQLLVVAILAVTSGCDRQDNDWGLYDPDLKLVSFPVDTIFLSEPASEQTLSGFVNISGLAFPSILRLCLRQHRHIAERGILFGEFAEEIGVVEIVRATRPVYQGDRLIVALPDQLKYHALGTG